MESPRPRPHAFAKKAGVDLSTALEKSHDAEGRIHRGDGCRRRAAPQRRFSAKSLPKEISRHLLGEEHVLASARRRSASCARCAGWWRCSMAEVVPLEFAGIRAGGIAARDIAFCRIRTRLRSAPQDYRETPGVGSVVVERAEREHTHPQGARCSDAHGSRSALARRQSRCSTRWST